MRLRLRSEVPAERTAMLHESPPPRISTIFQAQGGGIGAFLVRVACARPPREGG